MNIWSYLKNSFNIIGVLAIICIFHLAQAYDEQNQSASQGGSQADECVEQARRNGDGARPVVSLDPACYNTIVPLAYATSIRTTEDEDLHVVGYKNMFFVKPKGSSNIAFAGQQTLLKNIRALNLNPKTRDVLVLESSSSSILTFRTNAGGNRAPMVRISSKDLEGATSLAVNPDDSEIVIANAQMGAVLFFPLYAEGNQSPLRVIQGSDTSLVAPLDLCVDTNNKEVLVLDRQGTRVLVFDLLRGGNIAPKRVIELENSDLQDVVAIHCKPIASQFELVHSAGKKSYYLMPSNGG